MATPTRDVMNQSSDLVDYNLFTTNPALVDALTREGSTSDHDRIVALGARLGTAEMFSLGDSANRNRPVLKLFDRFGARRDEVEFHPAWHELMRRLVAEGLHTGPWSEPAAAAHVARAAGYMLWAEVENGTQCPATMTYGAVPTLAHQPRGFPRVAAPAAVARIRSEIHAGPGQARGPDGHGHDGAAGWLRCPHQHHARRACAGARSGVRISSHGREMVLLRAHVRRLPGARAGAWRPVVFFRAALPPGSHCQHVAPAALEGQGRQPLQRLQ